MTNLVIDKFIETRQEHFCERAFKSGDYTYQLNWQGQIIFKTKEELKQTYNSYYAKYLVFKADGEQRAKGETDEVSTGDPFIASRQAEGSYRVLTNLCGKILFKKKCDEIIHLSNDFFKFKVGNLWGLMYNDGSILIKPKYQEISFKYINTVKKNGYRYIFYAKLNDKFGIINSNDEILIPFLFDEIKITCPYFKMEYIVKQNGKYGLINSKTHVILPVKYVYVEPVHSKDEHYIVQNQKQGCKYIIDEKENIILDNEYFDIIDLTAHRPFAPGDYFVKNIKGKWGLITETGETVFDYKYLSIDSFNLINSADLETAFRVQNEQGLYGLIDGNEKIILPFEYDYMAKYQLSNNTLIVSKNGKFGVIDLKNNTKIDFKYKKLTDLNCYGDIFLAQDDNGKFQLINDKDEIININTDKIPEIKPCKTEPLKQIKEVQNFKESDFIFNDICHYWNKDFFEFQNDSYTYYVNTNAEVLFKTDCEFWENNNDFIILKKDDKKFVTDLKGNILIKPIYQDIESLYIDDYFTFQRNDKWGLIKASGDILIEPKYDKISCYLSSKKYISAKLGDKYGLIDEFDNIILPFEYDNDYFSMANDEKIIAEKNGKYGVINLKGGILIPFEYSYIYNYYNEYLLAEKCEKYGLIDWNNNVVLPFEFAHLSLVSDKIFLGNKEYMDCINYLYDFNGNKVCDTSFDWITRLQNEEIKTDYYIASHRHENNYGLADKFGNPIIDFKYKEFNWCFSKKRNQLYFVVQNQLGAWGIIDINDNTVIPFIYDEISSFDNIDNGISASLDGKYGLIDLDNNVLSDFKFEEIKGFNNNGISVAKFNNKWGLINTKGESIKLDLSDIKELKI